jgi:hypothetical protein
MLLAKAYAALPKGGAMIVYESIIDEQGHGPTAQPRFTITFFVWV